MNTKTILATTLAGIALLGALYGVYLLIGGGPDATLIAQVKDERPVHQTMWNSKASHTLTVFSDYQCPACKVFHDYLNALEASKSPNLVVTQNTSYVFRYYPLYQIHPYAMQLAYAAEAAGRQGKFIKVSNRFFADQVKLESVTDIKGYLQQVAKESGLDVKKFNTDSNDPTLQKVVQNDLTLGERLGVNSTPTFFLDGQQLDSMPPADLLRLLKELK